MIERSDERIKQTGEVFTSSELVNKVLDKLPIEIWKDSSITWLDPTCGDGAFLVKVKRRLLAAGHNEQYILNEMIHGADLMPDNVQLCRCRLDLNPTGNDGNIACVDGTLYDYQFIKNKNFNPDLAPTFECGSSNLPYILNYDDREFQRNDSRFEMPDDEYVRQEIESSAPTKKIGPFEGL